MFYKEFLRVRNLFYAFAICIGVLALLIVLLSGHSHVSINSDDQSRTSAAVTTHAAVQGMTQKVVSTHAESTDDVQAPGVEISDTHHVPWSALFALAGFAAALFGTVLGTCLAAENCGHLEVAWTRPASRTAYALRLMLVDAVGIIAIYAFTALVAVAVIYLRNWQSVMYMRPDFWSGLVRHVTYGFAWFGLVAGLTASVRTKAGAIAGFAWVGGAVLSVLLIANLPPTLHLIVKAINYLNPFLYASFESGSHAQHDVMLVPGAIFGLLGITVLGITAALVQWRRLEA